MATVIPIHPTHPQKRMIDKVVQCYLDQGIVLLATDSGFSLTCAMEPSDAIRRIRIIRQLPEGHFFTLMCSNISQASEVADIDNASFKLLHANTPGPCTFILKAGQRIPKKMLHKSRKTVGIRIPSTPVLQHLLQALEMPIMSVSLFPYEKSQSFFDAISTDELIEPYDKRVDAIVDTGSCLQHVSTILDCTQKPPKVVREGYGNVRF